MIVWRIAIRNLREHKTKTIIVGVLIAVAMTVLVAGNSFIDSITDRMQANYRESYTGDAVVHGEGEGAFSLFGLEGLERLNATVPAIPDYPATSAALEEAGIDSYTGLVITDGFFLHREEGAGFSTVWGVHPDEYLEMFSTGVTVVDGAAFRPEERGILLNEQAVDLIEEQTGFRYAPGDILSLQGNSNRGGIRIRNVFVSGIIRFGQANPQLDTVSLVDVATARELAGLDVAQVTIDDLTADEQALLGAVPDDDSLFGGSLFDDSDSGDALLDLDNILGDTSGNDRVSSFDLDEWHFLIIVADSARGAPALLRSAEEALESVNGSVVDDWQWAAGQSVTLIVSLQIIFNAVAVIITIVSIIIIVNTLVISITERIPEIGTIRAIGGRKRLVRRLITRETLVITGAFGLAGMILGALVIGVTAAFGIRAESAFLQLLLGGEVFRPGISLTAIVSSLGSVAIMAWLASLYPVRMATRISPVTAMQRG